MRIFQSFSSRETKRFANAFARAAMRAPARPRSGALVLALSGELGSGKTTFVQGFCRGVGVRRRATSPTFILVRRFALHRPGARFTRLYHVDAYRLHSPREVRALGFLEILRDPASIVVVEWPERMRRLLPRDAVRIKFSHGRVQNERRIRILAPQRDLRYYYRNIP